MANELRSDLTSYEKEYLKNKKVIKMCIDPDWMPFEKFDKNGKYIGMTADYYDIFKQMLGVDIKPIHTKTWSESIQFAKNRKCDILSLAMETPQRKKYLNFTDSYLKIPLVIATKLDVPFVDDISSIENKKVGIPKGYAFAELLRNKYPNLNIVDVENIQDGLIRVSQGELFGYIGTLASIGYEFQKRYNGKLKITGKFNKKWELGIGVRNDDKILFNIFQKVVNNLDIKQQQKILNTWISIKYEKGIDYTLVWEILIVVFIIILLFLYRQYLLKKANDNLENIVQEKTKDLIELNNDLEKQVALRTDELSKNYIFVHTLLESVIFGVVQSDTDGKYLDANQSTIDMMLYKDKSDLIGKNIFDFIAEDSKELVKNNILNNYAKPYELKLIKSDGTEFPVLMKGQNIIRHGQNVRLSTFVDISQVKEQERIIAQQSKLASMGEMIENIAHQWRQPLSIISTAASNMKLLKELENLTDDEVEDFYEAINQSTQYLSQTIDDFRDYIKDDKDKKIFDLNKSINSFLNFIQGSIEKNNIHMVLDLKEEIIVDGYESELTQCLINIFNNAKDVLKEKVEDNRLIFISTSLIAVENSSLLTRAIIKIKDNGGGIPNDIINKVFEPYFTTKHKSQGTGLGLHTTYNLIVEEMNGTIDVSNVTYQYDKKNYVGAEFCISLPLN